MRFKDKVVLITGSSRNIGLQTARRFGAEGAKVVINAASSREELREAEASLRADGVDVRAVLADTSKQDQAERLIQSAIDAFGRLDILVLNHSTRPLTPFLEISPEEWHDVIGVNLHSAFYLCRAALPHLVNAKTSSIIGIGGGGASHLHAATRAHAFAGGAAKATMLFTLGHEYAKKGVRVNLVSPGVMDTFRKNPEWYPGSPPEGVQWTPSTIARIPLGRPGTTDELASAVLFLASDEASYITGATLNVSGGWGG